MHIAENRYPGGPPQRIEIDENLSINRAVDILWTFRNIDLEEVVKLTTPVDYLTLNDGRQVLVLKQSINSFLKEKSILDS